MEEKVSFFPLIHCPSLYLLQTTNEKSTSAPCLACNNMLANKLDQKGKIANNLLAV